MIPKTIHYFWFSNEPLSELAEKCIASWKKYCPDYNIICWNTTNFDVTKNRYAKEAFEAKKWAFVTDYARLDVLYEYGGIYMDVDVEVLKNLDTMLGNAASIGFENKESLCTFILFAEKNNKYIRELRDSYAMRHFIKNNGSYDLTPIPITMTKVTNEYYNTEIAKDISNGIVKMKDGVTFYSVDYFNPMNSVTGELKITENTYIIHHFDQSWRSTKLRDIRHKMRNIVSSNKLLYSIYKFKLGKFIINFFLYLCAIFISFSPKYIFGALLRRIKLMIIGTKFK